MSLLTTTTFILANLLDFHVSSGNRMMQRAISASTAFLLLTVVSCLTSAAYGRELLGAKIVDSMNAFTHMQESTDKVAELEAKFEAKFDRLMKVVDDQQATINDQQARKNELERAVAETAGSPDI